MTKVIMTNSFRGGTGKSTVISNLGSYLASLGQRVILVDADIISPGIHAIFGLDQKSFSNTLTDYLMGTTETKNIVYDISHNLDLPEGMLYIVPSSMSQGDIVELLQQKNNAEKLVKAIQKISIEFKPDFILVDTHPGLNAEVLVASGITDMVFNVLRPDNQDYQGAKVYSAISKRLGMKTYIILNKVHHTLRGTQLQKNVEEAFSLPVAGMLPFSEDIILAQSQFVFSERFPDHDFSQEIQKMVARVFGIKPKEHLEIMHDILEVIFESEKITAEKLIQRPGISRTRYEQYIATLLEGKFIIRFKNGGGTEVLSITKKGEKFLKKYRVIRRFVRNFRL